MGQQAVDSAWSIWHAMGGGENDSLINSSKVDITPDLNNLPTMPVDPRFEKEKQRNLQPPKFIVNEPRAKF